MRKSKFYPFPTSLACCADVGKPDSGIFKSLGLFFPSSSDPKQIGESCADFGKPLGFPDPPTSVGLRLHSLTADGQVLSHTSPCLLLVFAVRVTLKG